MHSLIGGTTVLAGQVKIREPDEIFDGTVASTVQRLTD